MLINTLLLKRATPSVRQCRLLNLGVCSTSGIVNSAGRNWNINTISITDGNNVLSSSPTPQRSIRHASTSIFKPKPRKFIRRTYEQVVKPVVPFNRQDVAGRCSKRWEKQSIYRKRMNNPSEMELGLTKYLREHLSDRRLIGICEKFELDKRIETLHLGVMRKEGLETLPFNQMKARNYQLLIKGTVLEELGPLMNTDHTIILSSTNPNNIKALVKFAKQYPWLTLLGCVFEGKILTVKEAERIAGMSTLRMVPAETVGILNSPTQKLPYLLTQHSSTLLQLLQQHLSTLQHPPPS